MTRQPKQVWDVPRSAEAITITLEIPRGALDVLREIVAEACAEALEGQPDRPALHTIEGICAALQISRPTLARLRADGLPTIIVGDSPRYKLDEVLEWLRNQSAAGGKR
jgi:hypothetical protein